MFGDRTILRAYLRYGKDANLIQYFSWIGKPEIDKRRYSDLFFCNCNLGYRKDTYSGNMTRKILANDLLEIKKMLIFIQWRIQDTGGVGTEALRMSKKIGREYEMNNATI